jgi:hypothetical protein
MLTRENILLVVGAAAVLLGGAIFLGAFGDQPMWVEWLLGPAVTFTGIVMFIAGVALHCYAADSATGEEPASTAVVAKQGH